MKTLKTLASGALLLAAASASAQDAPDALDPAHMDAQTPDAQEAMPAEPTTTDPAEPTTGPTTADTAVETNFTDAQITGFVGAAMKIREIDPEGTMDDATKQTQAESIVAEHGLDPATYNAISVAAQSDPAVAERVQLAIAAIDENGDS